MDISTIISEAREITGFKVSNSAGDLCPQDQAISVAMQANIRDLNRLFGSNASQAEKQFTAVVGQQDYPVEQYVATDVYSIDEVLRSAADVPENVIGLDRDGLECRNGFNGEIAIDVGLQPASFRTIVDQERADRSERYGWELAPGNKIRLLPPPVDAEIIAVRYTKSGFDIESLPNETRGALVYAACVAILDAVLNRLPGQRVANETMGRFNQSQIAAAAKQRDRYERMYAAELAKLNKG